MLTEIRMLPASEIDLDDSERRIVEVALFCTLEACLWKLPPSLFIENAFCEMHDLARSSLLGNGDNLLLLKAESLLEDIICENDGRASAVEVSAPLLQFYHHVSDAIELYGQAPELIDMIHLMIWLLPDELGLIRYKERGKKRWIEAGELGREAGIKGRLRLLGKIPEFDEPREFFEQRMGKIVIENRT